MSTIAKSAPEATMTSFSGSFAQIFEKIYLSDDLDGFMRLMDKDAVCTFMATGERFAGTEQIREAAVEVMAGRIHTKDLQMELADMFWSDDHVGIEYLHQGLAPNHGALTGSPSAGKEIAVPICITIHLNKNGKIDRFNEYLNLATLSGVKEKLFFPFQLRPGRSKCPDCQGPAVAASVDIRSQQQVVFEGCDFRQGSYFEPLRVCLQHRAEPSGQRTLVLKRRLSEFRHDTSP